MKMNATIRLAGAITTAVALGGLALVPTEASAQEVTVMRQGLRLVESGCANKRAYFMESPRNSRNTHEYSTVDCCDQGVE